MKSGLVVRQAENPNLYYTEQERPQVPFWGCVHVCECGIFFWDEEMNLTNAACSHYGTFNEVTQKCILDA